MKNGRCIMRSFGVKKCFRSRVSKIFACAITAPARIGASSGWVASINTATSVSLESSRTLHVLQERRGKRRAAASGRFRRSAAPDSSSTYSLVESIIRPSCASRSTRKEPPAEESTAATRTLESIKTSSIHRGLRSVAASFGYRLRKRFCRIFRAVGAISFQIVSSTSGATSFQRSRYRRSMPEISFRAASVRVGVIVGIGVTTFLIESIIFPRRTQCVSGLLALRSHVFLFAEARRSCLL